MDGALAAGRLSDGGGGAVDGVLGLGGDAALLLELSCLVGLGEVVVGCVGGHVVCVGLSLCDVVGSDVGW